MWIRDNSWFAVRMEIESEGVKRAFIEFEFAACAPQQVIPRLCVGLHSSCHGFVIEFCLRLKVVVSAGAVVYEPYHGDSD